mmetsp:Transcript_2182/g.7637  ORF Transcript_2182/g.7637 Transcript_2182/m.7637 type:complete len:204 (+) Transcript_2182:537-1148(+)
MAVAGRPQSVHCRRWHTFAGGEGGSEQSRHPHAPHCASPRPSGGGGPARGPLAGASPSARGPALRKQSRTAAAWHLRSAASVACSRSSWNGLAAALDACMRLRRVCSFIPSSATTPAYTPRRGLTTTPLRARTAPSTVGKRAPRANLSACALCGAAAPGEPHARSCTPATALWSCDALRASHASRCGKMAPCRARWHSSSAWP